MLLNFLLVFLASVPHRIIFAQDDAPIDLGELFKNPGWKSMRDETIMYGDEKINMSELMDVTNNNSNISVIPIEKIRYLSIFLGCDQSKRVRKYIVTVLGTIHKCRTLKELEIKKYPKCVKILMENVNKIKPVITQMLNILTYFYQLSPSTMDYKHLYSALMTLKLYTDAEDKSNENLIETKLQEIEKLCFSIDLQLQTFAVMYCWPVPKPLCEYQIKIKNKDFSEMPHSLNRLVKTYNKRCLVFGFCHPDQNNIDTLNADMDNLWNILDRQQPDDLTIRIRWFGKPKVVKAVVHELASQYSAKDLAAFQSLSLKSVVHMFYKLIIGSVRAEFSDASTQTDGGLCPPYFFATLRENWPEIKSENVQAIREACFSIIHSKTVEECQDSFYESLNSIWLNFTEIKRPAIAVACATAINDTNKTLRRNGDFFMRFKQLLIRPLNVLQMLLRTIYNFTHRLHKALAIELPSKTIEFWPHLKIELIKFLSVDWPADITDTLKTLIVYLENEYDNIKPKDVIRLLELEMKTASADLADSAVYDIENPLERVRNFTDVVVEQKKSISNVIHSNVLLFNTFVFEETVRIKSTPEIDELAVTNICRLSTTFLNVLNLVVQSIKLLDTKTADIEEIVTNYLGTVMTKLAPFMSILNKLLLYNTSKTSRKENINITSAIYLFCTYVVPTDAKVKPVADKLINVISKPDKLLRITLLIISQIEMYIVQNCNSEEYVNGVINAPVYNTVNHFNNETLAKIFDDMEEEIGAQYNHNLLLNTERELNLSTSSIERVMYFNFGPLGYIGELQFEWNGIFSEIQYINTDVFGGLNQKEYITYLTLVQNSGKAIFLGYILNILQSAGREEVKFTADQLASILVKIEQFESVVYPNSNVDSPRKVLNGLAWCIEEQKISHVRANILKTKIDNQLNSFGMNVVHYNNVLKSNNILSDEQASGDLREIYVKPLEFFVDNWLLMFDHTFYSVVNYMKMII